MSTRFLKKEMVVSGVTATGGATISGFEKAQILFKEGFLKVKPQPEHYNVYVAPVEEEAPVAEEQSAA